MERFAGFEGAYGTYVLDGKKTTAGKVTGKPTTVRGTVTTELWEEHLAGRKPLGIVPIRSDNSCVWGCIDIDTYPLDHAALIKKIRAAKLPLLVCRSKSGGAHLFLFASESVPAETVQHRLREMAAALGWGRSEIFPKQTEILWEKGDIGNWLNMPYAGHPTTRYAFKDDGTAMTIEEFLDAADALAQSPDALDKPCEVEVADEFKDGPPCLQLLAKQGFPQGTRNNGLYQLGVFYKKAFPEDGAWKEQLERANRSYMDPPLASDEVQLIIKSLSRKVYHYKCSDQPAASFCNATQCRLRKHGVGAGVGVEIANLVKLPTEPAMWFVDVNGRRVHLKSDDLMAQYRFQRACLDQVSVLPPNMKNEAWRALLHELIENVQVKEIPPEDSADLAALKKFLASRPCKEGQPRREVLLGRAVLYRDQYWFRFEDWIEWARKNKIPLERNAATKLLKMDLKSERVFWNLHPKKDDPNQQSGVNVYSVPKSVMDGEILEPIEAPEQEGSVPF